MLTSLFLTGFENFRSNIDPEELFRQMFGNAGFGGFSSNNDFQENAWGHAPATEVCTKHGRIKF